jgi:para-aminobenzoate synthetase
VTDPSTTSRSEPILRTLLIDNHDSYTFNLFQLIAAVNGTTPEVLRNDDPALLRVDPARFDNIVISPGPGRPQTGRDVGHVAELLADTRLPVLGVCLGHQVLAHLAGGTVGPAPEPRHGHLAKIRHTGDDLFAGLPQGFTAVRYHSLSVHEPMPAHLVATAWAEDGVIMGLRHRDLPRWGVQFHPESIASQHGHDLIANFRELTAATDRERITTSVVADTSNITLVSTVVPKEVDTEAAFLALFAQSPDCYWLDSARVESGLSRFSFLGDASGPLSELLTYRVGTGAVKVRDASGVRVDRGNIFDVLSERLRRRRIADPGLPFDLTGGYVGYFGYELKADCGADNQHHADTPDAMWIFADRMVAVDHETGLTYVLAVYESDDQRQAAQDWVDRTAEDLVVLGPAEPVAVPEESTVDAESHLVVPRQRYVDNVAESQRQLVRGESYEICLTTKLRLDFHDEDLAFYRRLRRLNPAPYAALLRLDGVTVFCSSPERFLRIEPDGTVESKPIKGTAPRSADPAVDARLAAELAASAKTQAENLMIVDLLRNDLGQVCEIGTVDVPRYMAIESYTTVHQLVSTIRGRLRPDADPVDCVRHCFPGGSMTGAPKQRTMEIIDRLETEARGVYSGSLGYFGLAGGADLNIVIRTAVRQGDELTIGAGGAIVLDSDPQEEFEEMVLKATAPLRAARPVVLSDPAGGS